MKESNLAENIEKIFEQFLSQAKKHEAKELILELESPVKILTAQGEKNLSKNPLEAKELLAMTKVLARGQIAELKEMPSCEPGKFVAEGFSHDQDIVCSSCNSGSFSMSEGSEKTILEGLPLTCYQCQPGYGYHLDGLDEAEYKCRKCQLGSYQESLGTSSCLACNKGSYAKDEGLSQCQACDKGSYADTQGMSECLACTPGSYSSAIAATSLVNLSAVTKSGNSNSRLT